MAQYDLLLTQNVAASGVEFSEKIVHLNKGDLLSAITDHTPTVLAGGTDGYHLVRDDAEATGLKWVAIASGHTQNTDTGTTSTTFQIDSGNTGPKLKNNSGVLEAKNAADNAYADFKAKDATIAALTLTSGTISTAPSNATDIVNKTYADGLIAAADAMVYKGATDCSGNPNYPAANAGDTYRVSVAGKIGGASGKAVEVGDFFICNTDSTATGDEAAVGTAWNAIQTNLATLGTMAYQAAADYVANSTLDAHTILYAVSDNTPAALAVGASTIVGRKATGNIVALTPAEIMGVLQTEVPADKIGTGYTGTAVTGQIAFDGDYLYRCTQGGTATNQLWARTFMATNWP